jgi:hypothetical protein
VFLQFDFMVGKANQRDKAVPGEPVAKVRTAVTATMSNRPGSVDKAETVVSAGLGATAETVATSTSSTSRSASM